MVDTNTLSANTIPASRMLTDVVHTYYSAIIIHQIVFGFSRFPDFDKAHTADVTGQQKMFTSPWHLALSLILVEPNVCTAHVLYISSGFVIKNTVRYRHILYKNKV